MSSRSTVSRLTLIVSIIVALLIATSCSKKSEQSVEELVKAGLLQELPPATQGFIYWNFSSSEFKNYQKKMGAGGFANLIEKIVERQQAIQQMEQPEISRALTNWAQKHGVLVSESALGSPSVQEGVLFLEMKSDLPLPNLAMYLSTDTNQEERRCLVSCNQSCSQIRFQSKRSHLEIYQQSASLLERSSRILKALLRVQKMYQSQ